MTIICVGKKHGGKQHPLSTTIQITHFFSTFNSHPNNQTPFFSTSNNHPNNRSSFFHFQQPSKQPNSFSLNFQFDHPNSILEVKTYAYTSRTQTPLFYFHTSVQPNSPLELNVKKDSNSRPKI